MDGLEGMVLKGVAGVGEQNILDLVGEAVVKVPEGRTGLVVQNGWGAGHEVLMGGAGHEVLVGGAGHEVLVGGAGHEVLVGGGWPRGPGGWGWPRGPGGWRWPRGPGGGGAGHEVLVGGAGPEVGGVRGTKGADEGPGAPPFFCMPSDVSSYLP